jgi:hypothetical protein
VLIVTYFKTCFQIFKNQEFRKCYSNWRFCKRKMQFKAQQWLKLCTSLIFYVQTFQVLQKCSSKFSWFVIFEKLVFELHLEGWAFVYSILAPVLLNKLKNNTSNCSQVCWFTLAVLYSSHAVGAFDLACFRSVFFIQKSNFCFVLNICRRGNTAFYRVITSFRCSDATTWKIQGELQFQTL